MISVIIATLNEAENLPDLLAALADEPTPHEVIVVDGGSNDDTCKIAAAAGAKLIAAAPGRGIQLQTGAARALGETLWFLHADSQLPQGALGQIANALAGDDGCIGGNFRLVFDGDTRFARWLTGFYAWIRRKGLYYGDSGIFIRRDDYLQLGGIRPIALMEDYDLVRRMEKAGRTVCLAEPPLVTSSRRFEGRHPIAIFCGWLRIHLLFHLGVSPDRLAKSYRSSTHAPGVAN